METLFSVLLTLSNTFPYYAIVAVTTHRVHRHIEYTYIFIAGRDRWYNITEYLLIQQNY